MCHLLLLLPVFGLSVFYLLPPGEASLVYSFIVLFSGVIYWLIWRGQCRPATTGIEGMMGGIGTVLRNERGRTKVFYRGELWEARCRESLALGERVEIVGFERMQLIVRRKS